MYIEPSVRLFMPCERGAWCSSWIHLCVYGTSSDRNVYMKLEFNTLAHCAVVSDSHSQLCDQHSTSQLNNEWIQHRALSQQPASNESTTTSEYAVFCWFSAFIFVANILLSYYFTFSKNFIHLLYSNDYLFEFVIASFWVAILVSVWVVVCWCYFF